jgi:hypothetical protein
MKPELIWLTLQTTDKLLLTVLLTFGLYEGQEWNCPLSSFHVISFSADATGMLEEQDNINMDSGTMCTRCLVSVVLIPESYPNEVSHRKHVSLPLQGPTG